MTALSQKLRATRLARDLSLRDMNKISRAAITHTYVMQVEQKGMIPSPKKLRVFAQVLDLDFIDLMMLAGHLKASDL